MLLYRKDITIVGREGIGREGDDCVCGGVSNNGGWGLPAKAVDLDPLKKTMTRK